MRSVPIHVRCDRRGTWFVHVEDGPVPVSAHPSETHAERAAGALAREVEGNCHVVIHDRYARTHLSDGAVDS